MYAIPFATDHQYNYHLKMKLYILVIVVIAVVAAVLLHHTKTIKPKSAIKRSRKASVSIKNNKEDFDFITGNAICWKESI